MVTRNADRIPQVAEHMYGGAGSISKNIIQPPKMMYGKNRMFMHGTLEKGSEIGWHVHTGDGEVYYILSGEGEFNDNGAVTTVKAGDVTWTPDGEGHSLKATSDKLEFIALVIYSA